MSEQRKTGPEIGPEINEAAPDRRIGPMADKISTRPKDWHPAQALIIFNRIEVEKAHGVEAVEQAIRERTWLKGRIR